MAHVAFVTFSQGKRADEILKRWPACMSEFVRVFPKDLPGAGLPGLPGLAEHSIFTTFLSGLQGSCQGGHRPWRAHSHRRLLLLHTSAHLEIEFGSGQRQQRWQRGSMREFLPAQEVLNDHSNKQRIRKQPKARSVCFLRGLRESFISITYP